MTLESILTEYIKQLKSVSASDINSIKKMLFNFFKRHFDLNIDISKNHDELLKRTADGIQGYRRDKNRLNGLIRDFFKFASKYFNDKIDVDTYFPQLNFMDKTERMIEILKYLHEGPKTREEISAYFCITERMLSDYLNELQRGDYSFLGYRMKINLKRGENTYDSTIHPIFLPLNLSEVYALTVGLKLIGRKNVFQNIYDYIADCIYDQLSPYGKRRISEIAKEKGIYFDDNHIRAYRYEKDLLSSKRHEMLTYFLKSRALCKIEYDTNEGPKTVVGRVDFAKEENDYLTTKIMVINNDKEKIQIDIDSIISIDFAN